MKLQTWSCLAATIFASPELATSTTQLQNVLVNTHRGPSYDYPTDFTRGIAPIPIHSHNDYWRDIPFYSGLSAGAISTEADVWLYNDTLYVGHDESSLIETRTLQSLYIEPILDTLRRQNPTSRFVPNPTTNGVFDTTRSQTLYFFIDVKTDGAKTWPYVIEALKPLREANYLTTVKDNKTLVPGPVTVIGTGNTPLNLVGPIENRDYFIDSPLDALDGSEFTNLISPIASTSFNAAVGPIIPDGNPLTKAQLSVLKKQISIAKQKGIGARYWDTPFWPIRRRNDVWRLLIDEGVALLNVDDLQAAKEFF